MANIDDDDVVDHDQLPSVEEIRTASSRSIHSSGGRSRGPLSKKCRMGHVAKWESLPSLPFSLSQSLDSRWVSPRGEIKSRRPVRPVRLPIQHQYDGRKPRGHHENPEKTRSSSGSLPMVCPHGTTWHEQGSPHKFALLWIADSDDIEPATARIPSIHPKACDLCRAMSLPSCILHSMGVTGIINYPF